MEGEVVDPKYKDTGDPAMRIIEECGEIIQATIKGIRFGWSNFHPDRPEKTNLQELHTEILDLIEAFNDLEDMRKK